MKNILKKSMIGLLVFSFFTLLNTNEVSANELIEFPNNIELSSDTMEVWVERSYSTEYYNNDPGSSRSYNPFPKTIWYEFRGYVGYISVDTYYKSPTHYEVTYNGFVRNVPLAPLSNGETTQ